jgi:putative tricarboxylic transport membrane protein
MGRLNSNQLIALVLGVVAVGYTIQAYRIPEYSLPRPVDSDTFPKILGIALLILSVFLYFERPGTRAEFSVTSPPRSFWRRPGTRIAVTAAAIVVYALSLNTLGFVICSWVLSSGLAYFYGYRNHRANLVTIGTVILSLYLLMTKVLDVFLPNGPLPF